MKEFSILPPPEPLKQHHLEALRPLMEKWVAEKKVSPVLLFTGPSGSGKRTMLYYLAQWLLCKKSPWSVAAEDPESLSLGGGLFGAPPPDPEQDAHPSYEPCGKCQSCASALKNQWIDFQDFSATTKESNGEDAGKLKVDSFRTLKETMGHGGYESQFRIFLISDAENLTPSAANSLLKILEEPPPQWIFFLTATDSSVVLPTIVSRTQKIRMLPLTAQTIRSVLTDKGIQGTRLETASELAQGSLGRALQLTEDETWDRRKSLCSFFDQPEKELNFLVDWASQSNTQLELFMDQLSQMLMDLIRYSMDANYSFKNKDAAPLLKRYADTALHPSVHPTRTFWLERFERITRARQEILAPINKKLLVQDILLPWLTQKRALTNRR